MHNLLPYHRHGRLLSKEAGGQTSNRVKGIDMLSDPELAAKEKRRTALTHHEVGRGCTALRLLPVQ